MASQKQLVANRANALKSTGPRTLNGKAKSRYNALKHGLTAAEVVVPGEDPAEYVDFREGLMAEIAPQSVLEEDLTDRLATTLWRLRRIPLLENAFFAWAQHKHWWKDTGPIWQDFEEDDISLKLLPPDEASQRQEEADEYTAEIWPGRKVEDCHILKLMGRTVGDGLRVITRLSAYEARLLRQAERLIAQSVKLREARAKIGGVSSIDDSH